MKKITAVLKMAFLVLLFSTQGCYYLYAECYNEDACYKDYVNDKENNVVIAVNRDTSQVELYWSEQDNTWLKPDKEYHNILQKLYNKKLQLASMQDRLNSMHNNTWFNTNQGGSGRR